MALSSGFPFIQAHLPTGKWQFDCEKYLQFLSCLCGKTDSCLNGLVRPSCLIIDEIGHCAFDKENTRLFFDLIDRRYNKEGSFNMIFTSNKNPALWCEDFEEDATLLCTLDRIFDDATVFKLRGESFRGKKLETVSLQTGKIPAVESVVAKE